MKDRNKEVNKKGTGEMSVLMQTIGESARRGIARKSDVLENRGEIRGIDVREDAVSQYHGRGHPKTDTISVSEAIPVKRRGRPKGSKNKAVAKAAVETVKRGRPKGSKNKPKVEAIGKRKVGRPRKLESTLRLEPPMTLEKTLDMFKGKAKPELIKAGYERGFTKGIQLLTKSELGEVISYYEENPVVRPLPIGRSESVYSTMFYSMLLGDQYKDTRKLVKQRFKDLTEDQIRYKYTDSVKRIKKYGYWTIVRDGEHRMVQVKLAA